MPKVEAQRPLIQALVVRLYSKQVRLVFDHVLEERGEWPHDEPREVERVVARRVKGSGAMVSAEEQLLIAEHQAQLKTMVRYDWDYGKELIRKVHGELARAYPLGRGCDLSEANEMIQRGLDRLEAAPPDMHGLWYWLDRALERGLMICEEYRTREVMVDPEAREEALRR